MVEFSAISEVDEEEPPVGIPIGRNPLESEETLPDAASRSDSKFTVRGKWLQFDCPHCIRPMRLIAEDAGGLVDCAHCGLELIAPDPAIGRGARLSRASEGKVGQIARSDPRTLKGDPQHDLTPIEDSTIYGEEVDEADAPLDPNHSLARHGVEAPGGRKRAVKALEPERLGRAFRRQEVIVEQVRDSIDNDWEPLAAASRSFGQSRQDKRGFWIALGVAAAVMIGTVAMVVREAGRSDSVFDESQLGEIQAAQKQQNSRFQSSFKAAQLALASPSWEELAPHVREPHRVAPLMRAYYSEAPYQSIQLTSFHAPVEVRVGELRMHEMKVTDSSGETRTLVIEDAAAGPKLDWELTVNLARHDWHKFLEARPSQARTVCVIATKSSVLDRYFEDARLTRDEAIGIRLWHSSADNCFAILPKGDPLAKAMNSLLEWDKGRKIIIEASFDPASRLMDRIKIDGFIQTGWVIE